LTRTKQKITDKKTRFDLALLKTLKSQNVSFDTVLTKRKVIYFKRNSCLAEGGETRNVIDLVHKDVTDICVKASKVVGRYLVGIDIIC